MKKCVLFGWMLTLLALVAAACQVGPAPATSEKPALPTATTQPTQTASPPAPTPSLTSSPVPATATATLIPSPTPTPAPELSFAHDSLYIYPAAPIYAGDAVTFQVIVTAPDDVTPGAVPVDILVDGQPVIQDTLNSGNLGGDAVGLYPWVWTGPAGSHTVTVVLDSNDLIQIGDENPDNNTFTTTFSVLPAARQPGYQADATWISTENDCCRVHVVANTAAHRDLSQLLPLVDQAVYQASEKLDEEPQGRFDVYFIDRVIGQGGYAAGSTMVVSYLDRDYAGRGLYEVIVHEAVHALEGQFTSQRITFLAEGVAVWATGGHYKQEPLHERMAALVDLGRYVPLADLINDFYPVQHEIGYLEAASFTGYLVEQYGWPQVRTFYSDSSSQSGDTQAEIVSNRLESVFGITLGEAESSWLGFVKTVSPAQDVRDDLATTLRYYEIMRRYQLAYDPTAHFLIAWLPSPEQAQERGITADLSRHPSEEINIVLEVMLGAAEEALRAGNMTRSELILDSIERVLDLSGVFVDPLASNYLAITRVVVERGFEPQRIDLRANQAIVFAANGGSKLEQFQLALTNQTWTFIR